MYKYTMKCTNQRTFKITACQGLLSYHRQIGKQEDPGDEVGDEPPCKSLVQRSRTLMQKKTPVWPDPASNKYLQQLVDHR